MNPAGRTQKGVLRRDAVRVVSQPAMVGCADEGRGPISVVPLLDGDRVAGLEIHCGCGARALIECVYATPAPPATPPKEQAP